MLVCADCDFRFDTEATTSSALQQAILENDTVQSDVVSFLARGCVTDTGRKTIWVTQGECARVRLADDPNVVLASDEATTCVIAVAVCQVTGYASIAHFDESFATHFNCSRWLRDMTNPEIYLVGDFILPGGSEESVSGTLLTFLHKRAEIQAVLKLACIRELNTSGDRFPFTYSLAYDCQQQLAFPHLTTMEPSPARIERRVAQFSLQEGLMREVYDTESGKLHIPSIPIPRRLFPSYYLQLEDEELLQRISTSPLHEPPSFIRGFTECIRWVTDLRPEQRKQPEQWFTWNEGEGWKKLEAGTTST